MIELLVAIAAWCGAPNHYWTRLEVDRCREVLISCTVSKNEKDQLQCFEQRKLER